MRNLRHIDRSVLYYFQNYFSSEWGSHLNVLDGFPNDLQTIEPPCVAIDYVNVRPIPVGIGKEDYNPDLYWHIHIFGRNKGERDDIANDVIDLLESGCYIYDFSEGSVGDKIGYAIFEDITSKSRSLIYKPSLCF